MIRTPLTRGVAQPLGQTGFKSPRREQTNRVQPRGETQLQPFSSTLGRGRMGVPTEWMEHETNHKAKRSKQTTLESVAVPSQSRRPPVKGVSILLMVLAMIGSLHVVTMIGVELNRMVASQQEIARLSVLVADLEHEVNNLQAVVDHADDQNYREQLAREAGFAYPAEVRYLSVPSESNQAEVTLDQP